MILTEKSAKKCNISISYLVPAYNEEKNLKQTVAEILGLSKRLSDYEIVIVDDGSRDSTNKIITKLKKNIEKIVHVRHEKNMGFGAAYRTAYMHSTKNYCMLVPADNSHPADTLIPIIMAAGEADIVIPYVINPEARSVFRQQLSRMFVNIVNYTMGLNIPYYNGLVCHRTALLQRVDTQTSGFAYQAEILVNMIKGGASYTTVPTNIAERQSGASSAFKIRNITQVLGTLLHLMLRYNIRPLFLKVVGSRHEIAKRE
jgi:glycosyltransferase involved in cell wall biosynthesis